MTTDRRTGTAEILDRLRESRLDPPAAEARGEPGQGGRTEDRVRARHRQRGRGPGRGPGTRSVRHPAAPGPDRGGTGRRGLRHSRPDGAEGTHAATVPGQQVHHLLHQPVRESEAFGRGNLLQDGPDGSAAHARPGFGPLHDRSGDHDSPGPDRRRDPRSPHLLPASLPRRRQEDQVDGRRGRHLVGAAVQPFRTQTEALGSSPNPRRTVASRPGHRSEPWQSASPNPTPGPGPSLAPGSRRP